MSGSLVFLCCDSRFVDSMKQIKHIKEEHYNFTHKLSPRYESNEVIFRLPPVHLFDMELLNNDFETCELYHDEKHILDKDYNYMMNKINNTNRLNFWFTTNNNGLEIGNVQRFEIRMTFKNVNHNEMLLIKYKDIINYTPHKDMLIYDTYIYESDTQTQVQLGANLYKNIYIFCKDKDGDYIEGIDDIEATVNNMNVIEKTKNKVFTQFGSASKCKNVYAIPFTYHNKYESVGFGYLTSCTLDISFTKIRECTVKIVVISSNIGRLRYGLYGRQWCP